MSSATFAAIDALLAADQLVDRTERRRILTILRERPCPTAAVPRALRPKDAALRLGCCTRTLRGLVLAGKLVPIRLPGRARCYGYQEGDIVALIEGGCGQ